MAGLIYEKKIMLVDDDNSILRMIENILRKEGYQNILAVTSGEDAVSQSDRFKPDVLVLDIMLPDMDGYEVCKAIRRKSMAPILFLSAKSEEADKLISFALGGDEYITKPFSPRELLARIKAILVRQDYYEKGRHEDDCVSFGDCVLDRSRQILTKGGADVSLTAKEYALIDYLVRNKSITISKEKILENVWDTDFDGYENTVMVHIRHLREKVEDDPSNPKYIKTVKGRGYVFEA